MGYWVLGMGYGVWGIVYGVWCMGYGVWGMGYGVWCMGDGDGVWVFGIRGWCYAPLPKATYGGAHSPTPIKIERNLRAYMYLYQTQPQSNGDLICK